MNDVAPGNPTALEERIARLEASLKEATKKAAVVAVIAAILGSGGAAGLLQWLSGSRLRAAEATLKESEAKLKEAEAALKAQELQDRNRDRLSRERTSAIEARLKEQELALKEQQHRSGEIDLKLKGISQHREEFAIRLQQHQAVTSSLEEAIKSLKGSGDPEALQALVSDLEKQNQAFLAFAAQTESFVAQLPGAPSWYQGAVVQVRQASQEHQQRLAILRTSIQGKPE